MFNLPFRARRRPVRAVSPGKFCHTRLDILADFPRKVKRKSKNGEKDFRLTPKTACASRTSHCCGRALSILKKKRHNAFYGERRRTHTARKYGENGAARRWGRHFLCGALIGAGAILPGVSGGVMAVAFGIYRPFMDCLTRPKRAVREHWRLLLPLGIGWAVGFLLLARGLHAAMALSETVCVWLFAGLIAGSFPALFREAGKQGRPASSWVWLGVCAAGLWAGFYYVRHVLRVQAAPNFWWRNFCGALWGAGTVLPGFSASPVMMALGLYQPMLEDLSNMNLGALASCAPGFAVSTALLARGVSRLFRLRYPDVAHGILGVVGASALSMIPTRYGGPTEILLSGISCGGGFLLARLMERMDAPPNA